MEQCIYFIIAKRAASEHLTPKDVVITSGPAQANLVMFLKGQQYMQYHNALWTKSVIITMFV